jgi:hypothetical protein
MIDLLYPSRNQTTIKICHLNRRTGRNRFSNQRIEHFESYGLKSDPAIVGN